MHPITTKMAILSSLSHLIIKNHITYCWPKLSTIQKNLKEVYNIEVSISSIGRALKKLQDTSIIKSYRRRGRRADGTCYNKPSNRQLTASGINWLKKLGVYIPMWLQRWAYMGELPKPNETDLARDPQRPPQGPYINSPTALKAIFAPLIA